MTNYPIDIGSNKNIVSLLIETTDVGGTIGVIVYDVNPPEGVWPVNNVSPTLPLLLAKGYTKINFPTAITASTIELIGSGLEFIRAVIVNNLTVESSQTIHARAAGTVNGVNKIFTSPFPFSTVMINGIMQIEEEHYIKTDSTTFELSDAPVSDDVVSIQYLL